MNACIFCLFALFICLSHWRWYWIIKLHRFSTDITFSLCKFRKGHRYWHVPCRAGICVLKNICLIVVAYRDTNVDDGSSGVATGIRTFHCQDDIGRHCTVIDVIVHRKCDDTGGRIYVKTLKKMYYVLPIKIFVW